MTATIRRSLRLMIFLSKNSIAGDSVLVPFSDFESEGRKFDSCPGNWNSSVRFVKAECSKTVERPVQSR